MNLRLFALLAVAAGCATTHAQIEALHADQRSYFDSIRVTDRDTSEKDAVAIAKSSRQLSASDQQAVLDAQTKLAAVTPRPIETAASSDLVQIALTFDGTWNDRDKMTFDTNPALINDLFDGTKHYEKGVGTNASTKLIGGATGAGIGNRIDHAYDWLVAEIAKVKHANPRAVVVLIVTGFSRGATAARAFVNVVNKRGIPDRSSARSSGGKHAFFEGPRIGVMVLFDTVGSVGLAGTNLNPGLDLTIPANAENVLHLTARDEKRGFFPLSSAKDPAQPDDRITEIELPGAHSDVGGSYPNRYSQIPLRMAHDYMRRAGVRVKPMADEAPVVRDPTLRLHDSGGRGRRTVYPSKNPRPRPPAP